MTEDGLFVWQSADVNIWDDDWGEQVEDWSGGGGRSKRLVPSGPLLGATLYELDPGNFMIFHFHHGSEELLLVLRGQPTLRTLAGERQLDEGEAVHFPSGPDGAHEIETTPTLPSATSWPARVSRRSSEYPDLKRADGAVQARPVRDPRREGGGMSERDEGATIVELLLREPEIVAWLEPDADDDPDDDEPLRAA
jgi:quercetin dioxygenase-like cupin family protein